MSSSEINIIGYGHILPENGSQQTIFDIKPFLKDKKSFKFLSKQDGLALIAASNAWKKANIPGEVGDKTGIYLCVGILPFEDGPLDTLCEKSQKDGKLDFERFSTDAFHSMNPLLTFKCLPNMPLYHISYNLNITGSYFVTYPGIKEWFVALDRAIADLEGGLVEYAIVGAVADQNNFLVKHHMSRTFPYMKKTLIDSASVIVLTKSQHQKPFAKITQTQIQFSNTKNYYSNTPIPQYSGGVEACLSLTLHLEKQIPQTFTYQQEDKNTKLYLQMEVL